MQLKTGKTRFVAQFKNGAFHLSVSREASRTFLQFVIGICVPKTSNGAMRLMVFASAGAHEDATFQSAIFTVWSRSHTRRFRLYLSGLDPVRSAQIVAARR